MKSATRITLAGAAAIAAVGGMSVAAYAVSGGEELFKSPETLAVEEQNRSDAERLLVEQDAAITDLQNQITTAEAALVQAQAEYAAALANTSSAQNGTTLYKDANGNTVQAPSSPTATPATPPQPRHHEVDHDDNEHDSEEDHEDEDGNDD